ncbi:hypothetical protein EVA_07223 [gut metagenome]|uniref:Uncharacterized protein n=1 Tax=gut metagenome TaxID=749906 RepID=J9GVS6_9ZZZZ
MEYFVPKDELAAFGFRLLSYVILELAVEVDLEVTVVSRTNFLQQLLAVFILFPLRSRTFITTQVNVAEGENIGQFVNHILGELYSLRVGDIDYLSRNTLREPYLVLIGIITSEEVGIRSDCSLRVTGNVDLGNDFNETFAGILHNFAGFFLRIVAPITLAIRFHIAPTQHLAVSPATNRGQLRVLGDFDTPALVLGQVPVETVHLVSSHHVNDLLDFIFTKEVATFVEHKAAPAETGLIGNVDSRQRPLLYLRISLTGQYGTRGKQLLDGLQSIEETNRTGGLYLNRLTRDVEFVSFGTERRIEFHTKLCFSRFTRFHLDTRYGCKVLGKVVEHPLDAITRICIDRSLYLLIETKGSLLCLYLSRQWNQREFTLCRQRKCTEA